MHNGSVFGVLSYQLYQVLEGFKNARVTCVLNHDKNFVSLIPTNNCSKHCLPLLYLRSTLPLLVQKKERLSFEHSFTHHQKMAEQIADRIIETLGSLAAKEIGLLWGVQDELQSLTNTVSTIKDVFLDAEEKQVAGDRAVTRWLGRLEDAMFDAGDLLSEISTEALRREVMTRDKKAKKVRIFFSKSNQLAFRFKMAQKIKAITKRLDAINADRKIFDLRVRHVEDTRVGGMRYDTHSIVCAEAVIGRDEDKKAVIHRLLDSNVDENVTIHPIVGIGGLGKTTLAQLIFNDDQIQKHFQLKMWVCVSGPFDVQNMVGKILEAATKRKPEAVEMETLAVTLKEKIDGKKYLLVLDDVWNEGHEKWSHLKVVLMDGERGSRILVTTRSEIVASTMRQESVARFIGTVESYSLMGLDDDASWSLFKQMAFENGQEPEENSSMVAIGREILAKCSGVPLAIRTSGREILAKCSGSKNSETEWLSFKKNELSKISSQNENDGLPTLQLGYDHLPSHLKHCFAFCSLYPKDYKIDRSTLIQLWIAQGFVKLSDQNTCLEDVGNEYFMDLLCRSFFQVAETDEIGIVYRCKMHDLMHDLAISVAGSMITTLDAEERNVDEKTCHVSIVGDVNISSVAQTLLSKGSGIQTFIRLSGDNCGAEIDYEAIVSNFKSLKVLVMHKSNPNCVRSSIGKLKYLTYLDLSRSYNINKLPDSITRLQNLRTLRLSKCRSLKELPRDITKLVNLRHLEMDGCRLLKELPRDIKKLTNLRQLGIDECYHLTYMPRGLGKLTNLRNLSRFVVHSNHSESYGLNELSGLNNLRGKLVIVNLEHGKGAESEYKAANLKEKQHLHALHLWWNSHGDVNDLKVANDEAEDFQPHPNLKYLRLGKYQGSRLPNWILSLTNLVRFELYWCKKCQYLPPLSQLPSLKCLLLVSLDAMEYISEGGYHNEKTSFLPSLKEISLERCHNLKGWWRDFSMEINSDSHKSVEITEHRLPHSFPHLSTLSISFCPMLTSMPMFPHLEEQLILNHASLKPLQQTMKMNMEAPQSPTSTATTSSSSTPLSKLKSIQLNSFASSTPLSKLKSIQLNSFVDLETLPLQNLTSLESLTISDCPDEDGMQWQGLRSLLCLRLLRLPKLVSLPTGLQRATTLQRLEISNCVNLSAIPEWIHNCKSLQELEIRKCLSLVSLPEEMCKLTSLQKLTIADCPILLPKCKSEIGEDWPKIKHIPERNM